MVENTKVMNWICQAVGHKWTEVTETKFTWCAKCARCKKWSYDMGMGEHNCFVPSRIQRIKRFFRDMQFMVIRAYKNVFPDPDPF